MSRFKNDYNISEIRMSKKIHNLCTIGQDWFTNNIDIILVPDKIIPDYIEVDDMLKEFEGKELVIEELVDGICKKLQEYEPNYIYVISKVDDAMHLPVEVATEYIKK